MCGAIIYTSLASSLCARSHIGRVTERAVTADWSSSPAPAIALGGDEGSVRRFVWMHLLELPNAPASFVAVSTNINWVCFTREWQFVNPEKKARGHPLPESAFPRRRPDGWTQNLWLFVSLLSPIICSGLQEIKTENVSLDLDETDGLKKLATWSKCVSWIRIRSEISSAAGHYIFIRTHTFEI